MQIRGNWHLCDDGIVRPVVFAEVLTGDGFWAPVEFLVDTGADRTVFDADTLIALGQQSATSADRLGGLGGVTPVVAVGTALRLTQDAGVQATFRSQFAAVTVPESLDMSVLGRDITDLFAVIVDRPGNFVALIGQRHHYRIERR